MQAPNAGTSNAAGRGGNAAGRGGNAAGLGGNAAGRGGNAAGRGGNAAGRGGNAAGRGGNAMGRGGNAAGRGGNAAGRARCCCTCSTDIVVAAARGCYGVAPGSGTDGTPNRGPLIRPHMFALRVPFPSPLEAQIAHGSLAPDAEPHRGVINKQLMVRGNVLAIKWTSEDARLLRISIINCLEQLSLVLRTMQYYGPPIPR